MSNKPKEPEANSKEAEANYFAMHLLMPSDLLRKEIRNIKSFDMNNERHMADLAKRFQVSQAILGYRLAMLQAPE